MIDLVMDAGIKVIAQYKTWQEVAGRRSASSVAEVDKTDELCEGGPPFIDHAQVQEARLRCLA